MNRYAFLRPHVTPTQPAAVDAPPAEPQSKETPMSTNPVMPAPTATTPTGLQKFESVVTTFFKDVQKVLNGAENIALQEQAVMKSVLPPAQAAAYVTVTNLIAAQMASVEDKYAQIGGTTVPFAVKVAECAAVTAPTVLSVLAQANLFLPTSNINGFITSIAQGLSNLSLTNITAAPVAPPVPPAA